MRTARLTSSFENLFMKIYRGPSHEKWLKKNSMDYLTSYLSDEEVEVRSRFFKIRPHLPSPPLREMIQTWTCLKTF